MRHYILVATLLSGCTCAASSFLLPQRSPLAPKAFSTTTRMRRSNFFQPTTTVESQSLLFIRGGSSPASPTQLHLTTFDITPFNTFNGILLAANLLGFIISVVSGGSHLHLDLLGTGAFALAAFPSGLASNIPRVQLSAGCVSLWATKLASFLFFRALQLKHDQRLSDTLSTLGGTAGFWFVSLLWAVVASLPHSLGTTSSQNVPLLQSPTSIVGAGLFLVGFLTETIADYQKWIFKKNHPGEFCNVGLWSITQHPNFCGNLMLWAGIFLLNAPALIDPPPATPPSGMMASVLTTLWRFKRVALAALSPLFLYTLFNGQASGSFSNTQDLAQQKYGKNPEFTKYMETVPLLFPNPFKFLSGGK